MKKLIFAVLAAVIVGSFAGVANVQMMGGFSNSSADWNEVVEHTAREEQEGKELWNKLQTKEIVCENLFQSSLPSCSSRAVCSTTSFQSADELENPPIIWAFTLVTNEPIMLAAKIVKTSFFIVIKLAKN